MNAGERLPVEPFLERAMLEWLPAIAVGDEASARGAVETLAAMMEAGQDDPWLTEVMRSARDANWREGVKLLAEAIRMNNAGDREGGYEQARRSSAAFHASHSDAGRLRADLEAVYALSRSFRTGRCLEESGSLPNTLRSRHYRWAYIQALLARSLCLGRLGEFATSFGLKEEAIQLSERFHYPQLHLRALGLNAGSRTLVGDIEESRRENYHGLELFWQGANPPLRGYQFYSDLDHVAEQARLWNLGYLMSREAVPMIAMAGNRTTEAMARYRLAMFAGMVGNRDEADRELERAERLINAIDGPQSSRAFHAENMILLANAYLENGAPDLARKALGNVSDSDVDQSVLLALKLHRTKGALATREKRPGEALAEFEKALDLAESALPNGRTQRERAVWAQDSGLVYRELVRLAVERGETDRAWTLWEIYRSVSVARELVPKISSAATQSLYQFARGLNHTSVVSFVQFDDRVDGWFYDNRGVVHYRAAFSRSRADRICEEFQKVAASPRSPSGEVKRLGREVFDSLLGPVAERFREGTTLLVQPDGACAGIPFEALVSKDGRYLIEKMSIVTSPGAFAIARPSSREANVAPDLHAVIVGNPLLTGDMAEIYPELPDGTREANSVATFFRKPSVLTGRRATLSAVAGELPSADVFHFAGHGVSTSENGTLLLSDPGASSGAALLDAAVVEGLSLKSRLVVLSGCHSAAGERFGQFNPDSLVQVFWRASVPNVVAARWAIDSGVTVDLMRAFYGQLRGGFQAGEALRSAQLQILGQVKTGHPAYWAGFHVFSSSIPTAKEGAP